MAQLEFALRNEALSVLSVMLLAGASASAHAAEPSRALPAGPSFVAHFALEVSGGPNTPIDRSSGRLLFGSDGEACLRVDHPQRQEFAMRANGLTVLYLDEGLLARSGVRDQGLPPMLDALVAGLASPARALPSSSRLVEQKRVGDVLVSRWQLPQASGLGAEVAISEGVEGARKVVFRDVKGLELRSYAFSGRQRLGAVTVPLRVQAVYRRAKGGAIARQESWTLKDMRAPTAADPSMAACARPAPGARIREVTW
jgi:hypothetical protein